MLADALLSLERWDAAARDYRVLVASRRPQDPKAWYGLGRSYEGLSRQAFETLQGTAPDSPYLLLLVAEALVAQERDKSAFPLLREAIAKKPGLAEAHEALAQIYERERPPGLGRASSARRRRRCPPPDCRDREPRVRLPRRPLPEGPRRGPRRSAPRRAATGRRARPTCWPARPSTASTALPPSPEAALVQVEVLRAQRRYRPVEGGAGRGGRRLAGRTRGSGGSRRRSSSSPDEYAEARPLLEEAADSGSRTRPSSTCCSASRGSSPRSPRRPSLFSRRP